MDAERSQGVIVAGMHRSATSLVTSVLAATGWTTPGPLLAASRNQPRGHFEDVRMLELHNALLADLHTGWAAAPSLRRLRRAGGFTLRSRLAEAQSAAEDFRRAPAWAWKNPRATLFLEEWAELFPEAIVVLCVRSPAAVVESMLRRKNAIGITGRSPLSRVRRVARGVSVWQTYNVMGYRFARRHPDRTVIVRIPQDLGRLAGATTPSLFEPELLRSKARAPVRLIAACALTSQWLLWRLRKRADPQRLDAMLGGPQLDLDTPGVRSG